MASPFAVLAIDFHNTVYDEVSEYGPAIEEAVAFWREQGLASGQTLTRELLYKELSAGHRRLGSDWDGEVWRYMPSLLRLGLNDADFDKAMKEAENRRRKKSSQLTVSGLYEGVQETLADLKRRGVRIYVLTEASAEAAMRGILWLKLMGVVDGVYSYPSARPPQPLRGTFSKPFPNAADGEHLRKPHPMLFANLVLDEAVHRGKVPENTPLDSVFSTSYTESMSVPELSGSTSAHRDAGTQLVLKETPYKSLLKEVLDSILYIGDSKYKDGMLARNAGVAFGHATYGHKPKEGDEATQRKNLEVMYAVTGWDKDVMKLTQEAGRSETVNRLRADYTFETGLAEASGLFIA